MEKEIIKLLARGDEITWKYFIKADSKAAAKAMLKCLDIIKEKRK